MSAVVRSFRDPDVWQRSFTSSMRLFQTSQCFPKAEAYSLTDQMRRSSRSVSADIAEAWEKRRYEAAFVPKLIDSSAEVAETQNWIAYAFSCGYIDEALQNELLSEYSAILRTLHAMIAHSAKWCSPPK